MAAGAIVGGLIKLGQWALFGGTKRTLLTAGAAVYGANEAGNAIAPEFTAAARQSAADLAGRAVDAATGAAWDVADDRIADMVFDNIVSKLGVAREDFDRWYETIDPLQTATVFASLEGINMAAKAVGLGGMSHTSLAFAAIAFRFADEYGLLDKVGDLLVETGFLDRDTVNSIPLIGQDFESAAEDPADTVSEPEAQPVAPETPAPAVSAPPQVEWVAPVM